MLEELGFFLGEKKNSYRMIFLINVLSNSPSTTAGGAMTAGWTQSDMKLRLFFFIDLMFCFLVNLSVCQTSEIKSIQTQTFLNVDCLSFFSKTCNIESYKVPVERLHVGRRHKVLPSVQEHQTAAGGFHGVKLWLVRKDTPPHQATVVSPHRCEMRRRPNTVSFVSSSRTKIRKPCEVSSGVKYRPRTAHRQNLLAGAKPNVCVV